jgi:hypothetical protein
MRIGAGVKRAVPALLLFTLDTKAEAGIKVPTPCGRISPFAYVEPTESVAQAPRFARHLID